jgi:hypothetical protein
MGPEPMINTVLISLSLGIVILLFDYNRKSDIIQTAATLSTFMSSTHIMR